MFRCNCEYLGLAFGKLVSLFFFDRLIATRARLADNIVFRFEIGWRKWPFASKAFTRVRRFKRWGNRNALVKHKAVAVVMRLLALFKVLKYAAIELIDLFEAKSPHVGANLFTADPASTEHHHRLLFYIVRNGRGCLWEIAEVLDIQIDGVLKGTQLDFVFVPCIQQSDRSFFIEPLLERFRRDLGRRFRNG